MIGKTKTYKFSIMLLVLPALVLYLVVICYPILQTVYKSFFSWDGISPAEFAGIANYKKLFGDPDFLVSLKNGALFALMLLVYQVGMGTLLVFAVTSKKLRFHKFFKSAYFVPVILSSTVVAQLWLSIYNADYGLINSLLKSLGIPFQQNILGNLTWGILGIAFVNAWQYLGYSFVLLYAGVKSIPPYIEEAAAIDGASALQTNLYIKIPLLAEVYKFCLIFSITGGLKAFTEMFIMTGGGPGNANFTLSIMMYKAAFRMNEYGYGCAIAVILVAECLVVMSIINKFVASKRIEY